MGYKGRDLELRTPRPATIASDASGAAPWQRASNGGGARVPGAIAVDDTVLAACNRAYDIARFHASPDVRLEHLLHALTRVGLAVQSLTELGIRVDVLRRDTAVVIAGDMPASPLDADGSPQASAAFADTLCRAADQAAKRHALTGVDDVIRTMLGGGPGSPVAALLYGAATDPQRLERWRDAPLRAALSSAAPEAVAAAATGPLPPDLVDAMLGRLDTVAARVEAVQAQLAADRQALGDLLRDVRSALEALGGEGGPAGAGLPRAVEALQGKLGELEKSVGGLGQRLAGIDKLAGASDAWRALGNRMEAIEGRIGTQTRDLANRITEALADRLGGTETGLKQLKEETEKLWSSNGERQIALEASVRALLQAAGDAGKQHERDVNEIYQALVKLGANQQTLGDNFTAWRIESGGDIGIVSNRVQQLERTVVDRLGHLGANLQAWRQESRGGGRDGFKRWLYGTSKVFASGPHHEADLGKTAGEPAAGEAKTEKPS